MSMTIPAMSPIPPAPKTTSYTFTMADDGACIQFNAAATPLDGQLPPPNTVLGRVFMAKKSDVSTNVVNILGTNIEGMTSIQLGDQYASVTVQAVPNGYVIMAATGP